MKTICTKCGSDKIYVVPRGTETEKETQTLDEMVENHFVAQPAIYYPITWKCENCGYSITR